MYTRLAVYQQSTIIVKFSHCFLLTLINQFFIDYEPCLSCLYCSTENIQNCMSNCQPITEPISSYWTR